MRINILCNHEVALPSIQLLAYNNLLGSVAIQDTNHELRNILAPFCENTKIDLKLFSKKGFKAQLDIWLNEWTPDAVWVMTSPFIIPASLLHKPRFGFINFHYGLLPQYRGANPVFEQLRRRESHGGITVHKVDKGIDTGNVILQKRVPIAPTDTYIGHMNRLAMPCMEAGKMLLQIMMSGNPLPGFKQNEEEARYYGRPALHDVEIDWEHMAAADIIALCNACNPWNRGAATSVNGITVCITAARIIGDVHEADGTAGTVASITADGGLQIICADGQLLCAEIIYHTDGYMPGYALQRYNVQAGHRFTPSYITTIGN